MKLFLNEGRSLKIEEGVVLELLNYEEFVEVIKSSSKRVPAGHFKVVLKYKLVTKNAEYMGESMCDSYSGICDTIDSCSPYKVELSNWYLGDKEENFIEFNVSKK